MSEDVRSSPRPIQSDITLYDRHGFKNILGEEKRYFNIGYWKTEPETIDQACDELTKLAAQFSNFNKSIRVLDVGCGFGEQDFLLCEMYQHLQITALNSSQFQLNEAQKKCTNLDLSDRIQFQKGTAENLPFNDETFDEALCIEAAFHFRTRQVFLKEIYRVLKPGGRITLVDFCLAEKRLNFIQRIQLKIGKLVWRIPEENLHPTSVYIQKAKEIGFTVSHCESIWKDSYPPFVRKARQRLKNSEVAQRMNPFYRLFLILSFNLRDETKQNWMDYILICLDKPQSK